MGSSFESAPPGLQPPKTLAQSLGLDPLPERFPVDDPRAWEALEDLMDAWWGAGDALNASESARERRSGELIQSAVQALAIERASEAVLRALSASEALTSLLIQPESEPSRGIHELGSMSCRSRDGTLGATPAKSWLVSRLAQAFGGLAMPPQAGASAGRARFAGRWGAPAGQFNYWRGMSREQLHEALLAPEGLRERHLAARLSLSLPMGHPSERRRGAL